MSAAATTVSLSLPDEAATRALGAAIAADCASGSVILLRGPLGAGKTTLVDAFTAAFGAGRATSPTFVIAHSYPGGRAPIWHVDLYRIEDEAQARDLDLAQYMAPDAVTLVEWPDRAPAAWPDGCLAVELSVDGVGRRAWIAGEPDSIERVMHALGADAGERG